MPVVLGLFGLGARRQRRWLLQLDIELLLQRAQRREVVVELLPIGRAERFVQGRALIGDSRQHTAADHRLGIGHEGGCIRIGITPGPKMRVYSASGDTSAGTLPLAEGRPGGHRVTITDHDQRLKRVRPPMVSAMIASTLLKYSPECVTLPVMNPCTPVKWV